MHRIAAAVFALAAICGLAGGAAEARMILQIFSYFPMQDFEGEDTELFLAAVRQAVERPDGSTVKWSNPDTGNHGTVTPLRSGERDGRPCRLLEIENITGRGRTNTLRYLFCRQPGGSWKVE